VRRYLLICAILILSISSFKAFAGLKEDIRYQVVGPVLFIGEKGYSEYFIIDTDGKDITQSMQDYCLKLIQKACEKNYGDKVLPPLTDSVTEISANMPRGLIFIRGNLSRMELSRIKLGRQNNNYVLSSTGGVELLDLKTGEVFFSKIFTIQSIQQVIGDITAKDEQEFRKLFRLNIEDLYTKLINDLANEYQPGRVEATVCGDYKGKVILDKGRYEGIAERQRFRTQGGELSITSVQDHLCLAELMNGNPPKKGGEAIRIGANQIAAKGAITFLVTDPVIMRPGSISKDFQIQEKVIMQWVHDYLAKDSHLAMLPPADSTFLQQTEVAGKGTIAESTIRGNRALPDVFVRCRISQAIVSETIGEDGATYAEFLVRPELEFYDRKTGLLVFHRVHVEKGLERTKKGYREFNRQNYFIKLTKNAIFELTKATKKNFRLEIQRGQIIKVAKEGTAKCKLKGRSVGVGSLFQVFRPRQRVKNPINGKVLGAVQEMIGIAKVMQVKGTKGNLHLVVQQEKIKKGDIILSAGSTLAPGSCKKAVIIQAQPVQIKDASEQTKEAFGSGLIMNLLEKKLLEARYWSVLLNDQALALLETDQITLEGGEFQVTDWHNEKRALTPDQFAKAVITLLPVEETEKRGKILRLKADLTIFDEQGDELSTQSVKMKRTLSNKTKKGAVTVGAEEKDFPKHYIEMAEATLGEALRRCLVEFEK